MTKAELAVEVSRKTGVDAKTVSEVLEQSFDTIKTTIANGEGLFVRGFGSFTAKKRQEKTARNISKGTAMIIPAHHVPAFKASREFTDVVKKLAV